ncbi:uncharacterized protein [Haliotis asinina]|uniref:uncharacterized protein n=1 Tax=Haliotis asinina TaxID=109174 RepID=UPI0035327097
MNKSPKIKFSSLSTNSIISLTSACINSTYFTWGDAIYEQVHGLPMGSPLSPILTEIYMTDLEDKALETAPFKPSCWYRKVDDTFVVLQPEQDPIQLLAHLNEIHPRIKFTTETEHNNQLPFLDVLVSRTSCNQLQTSVYRKPTHTDQYIHFKSNHPPKVKTGVISTLTRRAKNICSANLHEEIEHLRKVFVEPSPSLNNLLNANGRKQPTVNSNNPKCVIYKINCDCGQSCIGETSRPIKIPVKEHRTSVSNSDSKSAISDHIKENPNHQIEWSDITILANNQTDFTKSKLTEAIHIKRQKPTINRDQGYFIPSAYDALLYQAQSIV